MNISEYSILSKIIAAYLKLDFQSEILSSLSKNNNKKLLLFVMSMINIAQKLTVISSL